MVQLKDIDQIDNGAQFLNVDLHIHSYGGSQDVTDINMTPSAIVDSAVRQNLKVIAITDHNSDLNVQEAIDYARAEHAGEILVLPGVEVTTAHGHLLAYFDPEKTSNLNKFLINLDLIGDMGADNTRTAKSMSDTILEAEKLGGICIAAHIDREKTGFEKFAPGFQNWKKDIICSSGLYGLECDALDALNWYSEDDEGGDEAVERKKIFISRSDNPNLKSRLHLAHLQGSDSHSLSNFENNESDKEWTRLKLTELSFEAVRIALIDPTARVRACSSIPTSFPRIRGMAVEGGFLNEEQIQFSPNLNCFIGGRGTGKSTAIRALSYALGLNNSFEDFDNCPDHVTVWCEDENGVLFRYTRSRGDEVNVKAKEDSSVSDVPIDAFHIEYFGQGELAKVAEDPLKNPEVFQDFLDRHINLRDLNEEEELTASKLFENSGKLVPLEISFLQLKSKRQSLGEVKKKLKVAEEGNLREIIAIQNKLASEKSVRDSIDSIITDYKSGYTFSSIQRDFSEILKTAGECTDNEKSKEILAGISSLIENINKEIKVKEDELNQLLKTCASNLAELVKNLRENHNLIGVEVTKELTKLRAKGISTNIPGLEALLKQKTSLATEIAKVEQRTNERKELRDERSDLLRKLFKVRDQITRRRKKQLRNINKNLRKIIRDYVIFVRYEDSGITTEFEKFLQENLHGTYIQDNVIENICNSITPYELAKLVYKNKTTKLERITGISNEQSEKIIQKLWNFKVIFSLQVLSKQPKPIITVKTKTDPSRVIPVLQLSDGQRHTILLTIAMLAESNSPLIIDQPEDDLDNAFIYSSIVSTLRSIKESRQVILVTHNANIAVLGDSELILPMYRNNDFGNVNERGAIDADRTKQKVLDILEGGSAAFHRRKEMYNH